MKILDDEAIRIVSGATALDDGVTFGRTVGLVYWGARNYLSETVYPYWFD